ncbi:hypothetical protein D9611_012274 [Ephemerocybe angulata]|uniref:F-box domain-containing protein n=1 Tax=Ephemerocybe angulata TaxID=980116 RepID=A0A8H5ASW6_9AGAR|nr:hypothetical protein D9611_012274 [Tulosesus angulatus]
MRSSITSEASPASIAHLPIELHILIVRYLATRPRSLFSLIQTCHALHTIYTSKPLWTAALHVVCERDALFFPSYPIETMSVHQIMRACLSPDLWNERVRRGDGMKPTGVRPLVDAHRASDEQSKTDDYNRVYFVPGGRYLLEHAYGVLRLWDLGLPSILQPSRSDQRDELRVVDSVITSDGKVGSVPGEESDGEVEFVVHPSPNEMRFRVWIVPSPVKARGGVRCTSSIYEIDLSVAEPRFELLASLTLLTPAGYTATWYWGDLSMLGNTAVFHSRNVVIVWNFVLNRARVWSVQGWTAGPDLLFRSESWIYIIRPRSALAWPVPPTSALIPIGSHTLDLRSSDTIHNPPPCYAVLYESLPTPSSAHTPIPSKKPLGRTLSHWYNSHTGIPALWDVLKGIPPSAIRAVGNVERYTLDLPVQGAREWVDWAEKTPVELEDENMQRLSDLRRELHGETGGAGGSDSEPRAKLRRVAEFEVPGLNRNTYCLYRLSGDMLFTLYLGCLPGWQLGVVWSDFASNSSLDTPTSASLPLHQPNDSDREASIAGGGNGTPTTPKVDKGKRRADPEPVEIEEVLSGRSGVTGLNFTDHELDRDSICSFTFCSASGRVAYSYIENQDGRGRGRARVQVLDFWEGVRVGPAP